MLITTEASSLQYAKHPTYLKHEVLLRLLDQES